MRPLFGWDTQKAIHFRYRNTLIFVDKNVSVLSIIERIGVAPKNGVRLYKGKLIVELHLPFGSPYSGESNICNCTPCPLDIRLYWAVKMWFFGYLYFHIFLYWTRIGCRNHPGMALTPLPSSIGLDGDRTHDLPIALTITYNGPVFIFCILFKAGLYDFYMC